jgi:adenylate cyclase
LERRLAAILAADVVGYTRLMGADEAGTLRHLTGLRQDVLEPLIAKHHGRVVKLMGDGLLVEFASVVDALTCAVAWQNDVAAQEAETDEDRRLQFRIGINLGDVIVEGDDIHGDGVNVAARLEGLAEPGGVCMSRTVFNHVKGKVELDFEDLGEQTLKNVAEPVSVYRIAVDGSGTAAASPAKAPLPLPDKPSIAVLPFTNMSGDPEQEHFSDGITENIITNLSRFRDFFVIARNSTFAYKGKAVKMQDVSRELGVSYVLEGSVQRSSDRVRITAQLIDGHTGGHLWSERYDRQLDDIFEVQDEVTEMIVGTLASGYGGRLRKAWQRRIQGSGTQSVQAFDCFMRGMDLYDHFIKEDTQRGREFFEEAVRLDPNYAKAYAKLAWGHIEDAYQGWSEDYEESLAKGLEFANKAIQCEDEESWGHWALAGYYIFTMQHDRALAEFQRAIELNPNDADVLNDVGFCLSYAGRAEEALDSVHKAMRLNPHYPEWYSMQLGQIYFDARQYEEAVVTFENLRSLETVISRLYLAASHAALGHTDEAQKAIGRILELDPQATLQKWTNVKMAPYKDPKDLEHIRENLRKAGLPG